MIAGVLFCRLSVAGEAKEFLCIEALIDVGFIGKSQDLAKGKVAPTYFICDKPV
jgi:hypothetical protein